MINNNNLTIIITIITIIYSNNANTTKNKFFIIKDIHNQFLIIIKLYIFFLHFWDWCVEGWEGVAMTGGGGNEMKVKVSPQLASSVVKRFHLT